ncbi:LysR family transcriptional regulator [Enterovibrio norvegicus]|uniref:LysR family transcriptional regulator n=1 Tax=Enterovibrio norvegicus TaxID=188144 RepID=A0ABV4KZM9_9GAMM|nr:LysR family transcriptional regulator [Enterovibrio norvegicus]MCC4797420.1 LysR family transcriptional regulator [Enterovibrio norvegicus]OEE44488.1 LysR family transcriptional regulator [Enterovibrio norvegicus]OEF49938.1 LysR family transcriptional regulator [Enterovibrio norvegicus]OEF58473.1 LysR family transcriptional regulator [Enterovibrio norvegicus]PMH66394.1 LysR family transcriptional regulator [Enterovibrio norvegicus]
MAKDLFNTLDLNLLRTFLVLFQEKNTRKAAERLFVTQPAVSQNLKKLRHHFNDELFIKVQTGLETTPEAERIASAILPHIDALYAALGSLEEFDPKTIRRKIRLALGPQVLTCISGALVIELKKRAPYIELDLVQWTASTLEDISNGDVLLGINYQYPYVAKHIKQEQLTVVTGCCAVRNDHPISDDSVTPETFSKYEIASLLIPGWSEDLPIAAKELKELGLPSPVGFRSAFPMAIIDVIQRTDMYYPTTDLFPFDTYSNIRRVDVRSDSIEFNYPILSYTHQRNKNDALVAWLNELLTSLTSSSLQ